MNKTSSIFTKYRICCFHKYVKSKPKPIKKNTYYLMRNYQCKYKPIIIIY